jgi:predicted  nucleic acid-binding Zn-ribbon protein
MHIHYSFVQHADVKVRVSPRTGIYVLFFQKRMGEEIKELKTETVDLRQELQATEDTLDERIVELWKEQEKLKDNERKCKDQIELLRCTLRERNAKKKKWKR